MGGKNYQAGDEPVPGYQLEEYLGRGGFGEVWRAQGPGGVQVALKLIHDLDRKRGGRELRALRLLKNIRHPNLVPLTGFWLRTSDGRLTGDDGELSGPSSGEPSYAENLARSTLVPDAKTTSPLTISNEPAELIIAMGLCEESLFDRMRAGRAEGDAGMPLPQLLRYMEDAARAIDLLNVKHDVQHCDIKPQNILVLSDAAQVADFGLAKMIGDVRESSMGAGTIAYGAPEVLLGNGPSPATDQYSLAISYYELRTGQLPFDSDSISRVLSAKQQGTIDLSELPAGERAAIAKATALDPADRFESCSEMVRALQQPEGLQLATVARRREARPLLLGLAALGLVVPLLIAGSWAMFQREPAEQAAAATAKETAPAVDGSQPPLAQEARAPETEPEQSDRSEALLAVTRQTAEQTARIAEAAEQTVTSTATIAAAAATTAANTDRLVVATERMTHSLDAIRSELAQAMDRGGLIATPESPSDFYHNARLYEQRGDYRNARQSYAQLLAFRLNVVDPHLNYQRILRIQEGRPAAREVYSAMLTTQSDLATQFAALLLQADGTRRDQLAELIQQHPDYGPGLYYLSREYSKEVLGVQGLADMAAEKELLEQFLQLADDGRLLPHFLDQSQALSMIDEARTRLTALQQFDASAFEQPIRVSTMMSNASWSVNLLIAEVAREIHYRLAPEEPFRSTGMNSYVDQRTGSPAPRPSFELPLGTPRTTFWIKYVDIRGTERGPFELVFDPDAEKVRNGKRILTTLPHAWLSFRNYDGQLLVYFSHLVSYRYALEEIRYSVDSEALDQVFPLGPVDPRNPHAVTADMQTYITVPTDTRFVLVELTFRDQTNSPRQRFEAP